MNRAFARIQVHEARIAEARIVADRAAAECPERCAARSTMASERDAICSLARDLGDVDALHRCRDASAAHDVGGASARKDCGCAAATL